MISKIRRIATVAAATAVLAGAGAGIASATPETHIPARTGWEWLCVFDQGFDWHYYNFCDRDYWHGRHHEDWNRFHRDHWNYDHNWFPHR